MWARPLLTGAVPRRRAAPPCWRYQRYCKAADKVDYRGTLTVTPEVGLFTPDGTWRIASLGPTDSSERHRLAAVAEGFLRSEDGASVPADSIFPIEERTIKVFAKATGQVLAVWKAYYYKGGFLRRGLLDSSSQCFPSEYRRDFYQRMFVLERK